MKGEILWILCENCLYCSEIKRFHIGSPGRYYTTLDLIPIVGDIDCITIFRNTIDSNSVVYCNAFKEMSTFAKSASVSFSFEEISKHLDVWMRVCG